MTLPIHHINGFGTKYSKDEPFKKNSHEPTSNKKVRNRHEVKDIVQQAVDDIIQQET